MLEKAGWHVCDFKDANIHAARGVVIRNYPLSKGHGFADYLFYIDGKAAGVIEAKKAGTTLTGVEIQSDKYKHGFPEIFPAWYRPLPFCYQSTGVETRFTNGLDSDACSRNVFSFHKPDTLEAWLNDDVGADDHSPLIEKAADYQAVFNQPLTLRSRLRQMPPLKEEGLWPAQIGAIRNLERSLAENRPRALIQMATGSGKTFTAVSAIYRMIKYGGAGRVLFLVDRANLGRQTLKEFQQYASPYSPYKFTEEYIVQQLQSNKIDQTARVCISTIQRLYSILRGEEISEELEEESLFDHSDLFKEPMPVEYNPAVPIETFDVIITDECHRSIYGLWRQVLDYFDAFLVGLTATPNKQTFGFFNQNLVMEYPHEQAVADGVNVNYDVYQIRTKITQQGSKVDAGYYVDKRDRETRAVRWEQLDEELTYGANQLDADVVALDQIRTVVKTFRDKLFTDIFPGRKDVPKTLIFAKDDSHAEDIVKIVREEFGKGNDFCQKITYKTTGVSPEALIASFRNSYFPRIAVTVDMIATGTDIKPLEIVFFMRTIKSRTYFEQMKGRGVRVINPNDLQSVTPDAKEKDHFVIVDAVGVCEQDKTDSRPMEKKRSFSLEQLLQAVALGNTEPEVISSIAARFARLEKRIAPAEKVEVQKLAGGKSLKELTGDLVQAIDPDRHVEQAKKDNPGVAEPSTEQIKKAATKIIQTSVKPLHTPELRKRLVELYKTAEQTIDVVSKDEVLVSGFSAEALENAKKTVTSFEQFIKDHKDEITALQILYSRPYKARLRFEEIKALAQLIEKPPYLWKIDRLWEAYAALEKSKVKGASAPHILTDLVSLVRFAIHQDNELVPFPEKVNVNFNAWMTQQEINRRGMGLPALTGEQHRWLEMIRDHIAANLSIDAGDFDYAPFAQQGGLGKVHQVFGDELNKIMEELNGVLAA
ncbi:MAG: DEAD/DEAH box helicase family protein [Nitrospiraceae bacterium]|nr:DEAD/DEAH box helicase family protein [Nitrospiraceae bacterium]